MKLLGFVDDEWAARSIAWLAGNGADIAAVAVAPTDAARRVWAKRRPPYDIPVLDGEAGAGTVLSFGAAGIPDRLAPAPRLVVTASCPRGPAAADPVHWCLRTGCHALTVHIVRTDGTARALGEVAVQLAGLDYPAAVTAAAAGVWTVLAGVDLAAAPDTAGAAPIASLPVDVLPVDRASLYIDWSADADDIVRLVRATAGRLSGAWTYLDGFPVTIGQAAPAGTGYATVHAGTIVRRDSTRVVVQTGRRLVAVSEIRDAVGPLAPALLRPGLRFGAAPADELRALRRRVADLETMIRFIMADHRVPPSVVDYDDPVPVEQG